MAARKYRTAVPFDLGAGQIAPVGSVIELEEDVARQHGRLVELVGDVAAVVAQLPTPVAPSALGGE